LLTTKPMLTPLLFFEFSYWDFYQLVSIFFFERIQYFSCTASWGVNQQIDFRYSLRNKRMSKLTHCKTFLQWSNLVRFVFMRFDQTVNARTVMHRKYTTTTDHVIKNFLLNLNERSIPIFVFLN